MNKRKSLSLYDKAVKLMPGGVNSPVRACKSVGINPIFINHADGCLIYDVDGNCYVDYVGSWGAMILGHKHPNVINAVKLALEDGMSYGAPTSSENELAELIIESVKSVEMIRMVNSGTEATMSAIRLARGYTGRNKIIKFDGCYHGHVDSLLVAAGSGMATLKIPASSGVPNSFIENTISLPFNNIEVLDDIMKKYGDEIASIIVEPIAGNMGPVKGTNEFINYLRDVTYRTGSLLIFDEVISGFRVSIGGAQQLYDVEADLTCFGKIIGGGMPVGAYGGSFEIMRKISPLGKVYQAGTLSGNPLAMAAGIATLLELKKIDFYENLEKNSQLLFNGINEVIKKFKIPVFLTRIGSMIGISFNDTEIFNFNDAKKSDTERFSKYYKMMFNEGIYLPPSQFETIFVSSSHDILSIKKTIRAFENVFSRL